MALTWLGKLGEVSITDPGNVSQVIVPLTTPLPVSTPTESVMGIVFLVVQPGGGSSPLGQNSFRVTDDAVADNADYGTRWSPYKRVDPEFVQSTYPPDFGQPNQWYPNVSQSISLAMAITGGYARVRTALINAAPDNIIVDFVTGVLAPAIQDFAHVIVYGITGLSWLPWGFLDNKVAVQNPAAATIAQSGGINNTPSNAAFGPGGFCMTIASHNLSDATPLDVSTDDGPFAVDDTVDDETAAQQVAFARTVLAGTAGANTLAYVWTGSGSRIISGPQQVGDSVDRPDQLTCSLSAAFTVQPGNVRRYVVKIVDDSGIPADDANHMVTPFWRIPAATDPGTPGWDGKWSADASDEDGDAKYWVENEYGAGFYIDVPPSETVTLNAFLYDGVISNEATIDLVGAVGGYPTFNNSVRVAD